jgi:hypothetical protein
MRPRGALSRLTQGPKVASAARRPAAGPEVGKSARWH